MKSSTYMGRIIAGRFRVDARLGEGASGTVWVARDLVLGIDVALKVLRSWLRNNQGRREAFEREAQLCARMLSPHVVRVLAFGVDTGDLPYIVYELLPGESLAQRIARAGGSLDLESTESIIVQVARGLARAHSLGIAHQDIKPSNIILLDDERARPIAKILDFGIARHFGRGTVDAAGNVYGTLEYVAPELIFSSDPPDSRCDLYALGVVAHECLTGRPPHRARALDELVNRLAAHLDGPASVIEALGEEVGGPFDAFFARALAQDPAKRFQTARAFAEELHEVVKVAKASLGAPQRRPPSVRTESPRRARMPSFVFDEEEAPPSSDPRREP